MSLSATDFREKLNHISGLSQEGKQALDDALTEGNGFIVLRHGKIAQAMLENSKSVESSDRLCIVVLSPEDSNLFFRDWEKTTTGQLMAKVGSSDGTAAEPMLSVYPDFPIAARRQRPGGYGGNSNRIARLTAQKSAKAEKDR
jgi:hypothetical protein